MLQLAPIFQDGAVLQRDTPIPVWGRGIAGRIITARLIGRTPASTTVGEDGFWLVRLPPEPAGGPVDLEVRDDGGEALYRGDLLVGDVWLCSGQSNMEWKLIQVDADGSQAAGADHPRIRLLTLGTLAKPDRQSSVGGVWQGCTPETIRTFSAVAGWFGRSLHRELEVPIGLIANAWGGTRIEAWLSREALMTDPETQAEVRDYEALLYGHRPRPPSMAYATADDWFRAEGPEDPHRHGERRGWHRPDFDDQTWPEMELPCRWQDRGHAFNGIFWFRRRLNLPPHWRGRALKVELGSIDKHDETYANGQRIGGMSWENREAWCTPRRYTVPGNLVGDRLTLAVRVRSHLYHGGMIGPAKLMTVSLADQLEESIGLAGPWRYQVEQNWGAVEPPPLLAQSGPGSANAPYTLFNSRVAPLVPYAIRGFCWYQGESNAHNPSSYRRYLPLLIHDWRRTFAQGDLPFLLVQLANYMPASTAPEESAWAELREAQRQALALPNTGLVVSIDVGEAEDIHPKDKKTVGLRLARWALCKVYQRPILPSGPLFRSLQVEPGGRLRVTFDYAEGLRTREGGPVRHLAIAGGDGRFLWAESALDGESVLAWHPAIPEPRRLRYAWANNPEGCNLVNRDDLPAAPFQATL